MRRAAVLVALPLLTTGVVAGTGAPAAAVPGGGVTARLSHAPGPAETNGPSGTPAVADNGHVAYVTYATGLGFTDANDESDVVVSTAPGTNVLVSRSTGGAAGNAASDSPAISPTGRYVAFRSDATDLGVTDTNAASDVYLVDRDPQEDGLDGADRTLTRVSTTGGGGQANGASDQPAIAVTPQGVFVAFRSTATNLAAPDRNKAADVFVKNVATGAVTRVSVGAGGIEANGPSANPTVGGTASELVVAFESLADNLALPDDGNGVTDVYARVVGATSSTELISRTYQNALANAASYDPSITADGATVAFASDATTMVANDTNGWTDVFLRTRGGSVSVGVAGNGRTDSPALSGDGRALAVRSFASNLATPDTNGLRDVLLRDLVNGTIVRTSSGVSLAHADGRSEEPAVSSKGEYVAFRSDATNLVASDTNGTSDVFRRRRDVTAPTTPVLGGASTSVWTKDATIDITLSASDPSTGVPSGLDGYGIVWDTSPSTVPAFKTHEETATAATSPTRSTGSSHWVHVRAVDNEGNWGPVAHRGPFWVDTTKPQVGFTINGNSSSYVLMKSTSTPIAITASDAGSGLDTVGFKIYYERARYDKGTAGYEPRVLWRTSTATTHTFVGAAGYTYHFVVERQDKVGNLASTASSSFVNGYVIYPADETSAAQVTDTAWTQHTSTAYYGGEAQRSTTGGTYLRLPVKYAKEVGVLARICDGCGTIQLYVNGAPVGSAINLDHTGTTTTTHNYAHTRNLSTAGSGYLDIKVTSSGKPVTIAGIVVRR